MGNNAEIPTLDQMVADLGEEVRLLQRHEHLIPPDMLTQQAVVEDIAGETSFDAIVDHDLTANDVAAKEYMSFTDAFANVPPQGTNANTIRIYLRTNNGAADETVVIPAGYSQVYIEGRYSPRYNSVGSGGFTQMDQLTFSGAGGVGGQVYHLILNGVTIDDLSYGASIVEVTLMNSLVSASHANTGNAKLNLIDNTEIRIPSFVSGNGAIGLWFNNTFSAPTSGTTRPSTVSGAMIVGNKFIWSSGTTWTLEIRHIGFPSNDNAHFVFSNNSGVSDDYGINFNGVTGTGSLYGTFDIHNNDFATGFLSINSCHPNRLHVTDNQMGTGGVGCGFGSAVHLDAIVTGNHCAYVVNQGYYQQIVANNYVSNGSSGRIHLTDTHSVVISGNILPNGDASVSNRGAIWVNLGGTGTFPHCSVFGNSLHLTGGTSAPAAQRNAIEIDADGNVDYAATVSANHIWWAGGSPLHANYYAIRFGANGSNGRLRAHSNVGRTGTIMDDDSGVASVDNSFGATVSGGGGTNGTGPSLAFLDEGVAQGSAASVDVVGAGASVAVAGGVATLTVSGGGSGLASVIDDPIYRMQVM